MVALVENRASLDQVQKTRTLIYALNLISRNLPLPPEVFDTVSSIYLIDDDDSNDNVENGVAVEAQMGDGNLVSEDDSSNHQTFNGEALITEFEDAL